MAVGVYRNRRPPSQYRHRIRGPIFTASAGIANVGDGGYNSANASAGTASLTLAFPAGISAGELVLASVCVQGGPTPTVATPTGWIAVGNVTAANLNLYLFAAIYTGGLTGTFVGTTTGGMDGNIRALSGTGSTVGTALGNFTSVSPGIVAICTIPGPSGFTAGQWNYWCSINVSNFSVNSTSPALSNIFYNAGVWEAFEVGTTAPGSAPGSETITWSSAAKTLGVGVTILPGVAAPTLVPAWFDPPIRWKAPPPFEVQAIPYLGNPVPTAKPSEPWFDPPKRWVAPPGFETEDIPRPFGISVPTALPPQPWFDPPKRWVAPPGFEHPAIPPFGTTVPTAKPSEPWFDPPKRWKAPPGFEVQAIPYLGIPVPTAAPQSEWWQAVKQPSRQTVWNPDVLQPFAAAVVQPTLVSTDFWSAARRSYSTLSWDGNSVPLGVITPTVPQEWWTTYRNPYRVTVWDSQTPQPFGTTVPTTKPSEPWFDPPKRWVAPPGFADPPWRNLGTTVPQVLLPEPFWVNPSRRYPIPGFTTDVFSPVAVTFSSDAWWSPYRQTIKSKVWNTDVLQPFAAAVVQPPFVSTDWWPRQGRYVQRLGFYSFWAAISGTIVPTAAPQSEW